MPALRFLCALVALCLGSIASAHALPGTAALLDFGPASVGLELDMPLDQFELGFGHPVMDAPMRTVARYPAALRAYLVDHVKPVAPDGRPWRVTVETLRVEPATDVSPVDLVAHLRLTPPPSAPVRRFRLNYSVINHEVMTHTVLVFARSDWRNGVFAQHPALLGSVRWLTTGIDIDRAEGSFWTGLMSAIQLGMRHIAEGTDHLLFLLALLLPAPLLMRDGRWADYGGARHALVRLGSLVTAFTLGHSSTLLIGAFTDLAIPTRPIEVLIALSILAAALHAWRPIFRGHEALIALVFGLIHGLAFSQAMAANGLEGWQKIGAVLGFNFGIELVQLLVVACAAPCIILLVKANVYASVRLAGAAFAAVAALAWAGERLTGKANFVSVALNDQTLLLSAVAGVAALALGAAIGFTRPAATSIR